MFSIAHALLETWAYMDAEHRIVLVGAVFMLFFGLGLIWLGDYCLGRIKDTVFDELLKINENLDGL
jgi:hypothetical protein